MIIRPLPRRWWPAPICSIAAVWAFCQSILARWGYGAEYQISAAVVFVAVYIIYSSITSLPFALYKTYVGGTCWGGGGCHGVRFARHL